MYSQFRAQYPMASLTSNLLVAEPSHYVVQAVVKMGGAALATGLSAASTVEVAEDQARARALMILGIAGNGFSQDVQMLDDPSRELPPGAPARLNPAVQSPMSSVSAASQDAEWNWPQAEDPALIDEEALPEPYLPEPSQEPLPSGLDDLPRPAKGRRKTAEKAPKRGRTKQKDNLPPEPIDLSDVIAQTDIELKRLGWTHVQGRQFLAQTYNKRSRQQLTDSELLEFLEYLKVQSGSQDPPF